MEKKINWKAWASVGLSTFVGAALAFYSMPHEGKGTKELLIGAALAGASAVLHLLQKPYAAVAAPAPAEEAKPVDTQGGP